VITVACIYTTSHFSGAAVSLAEVLKFLKAEVRPVILTPRGSVSTFFERSTGARLFPVRWLSQFDHTRHGRYRGVRWLVGLRELLMLPGTWLAVRRFAASLEHDAIDLIHLNEVTGIVPAVLLKRHLRVPLLVHVRAHMGDQSRGLRSRVLRWLLDSFVDDIICIDETVRQTLPAGIKSRVQVVHNALNIGDAPQKKSATPLPAPLESPGSATRIGIVGSLLRVKGIFEFIESAVELCKRRDDVVFAFVGSGVREMGRLRHALFSRLGLAENAERIIRSRIEAEGLQDRILMTGHREDLATVYSHLDILCFPSHYNAPGRPIFEAAYFGKPSIVAIENPCADTLVDGVTGVAIPAKDSSSLTRAMERLVDNPSERHDMGMAAKDLAERNFRLDRNAGLVLDIYRRLAAPSSAEPAGSGKRTQST